MTREQRVRRNLILALEAARALEGASLSHLQQLRASVERAAQLYDLAVEQAAQAEANLAHLLRPGGSATLAGVRYTCDQTPEGLVISTQPLTLTRCDA